MNLSPQTRAYIYRVAVAAVPTLTLIAASLGVNPVEFGTWTAAVLGLLSTVLAIANTSTKAEHPEVAPEDATPGGM